MQIIFAQPVVPKIKKILQSFNHGSDKSRGSNQSLVLRQSRSNFYPLSIQAMRYQ